MSNLPMEMLDWQHLVLVWPEIYRAVQVFLTFDMTASPSNNITIPISSTNIFWHASTYKEFTI